MPADTLHYLSVDLCVITHEQCLPHTIDQEHLAALVHAETRACALIQLPPATIKRLLEVQLGKNHDDAILNQLMMQIPSSQPTLDGIYLSNNGGHLVAEVGYRNNGSAIEYFTVPSIDTALCVSLMLDHLCPDGFPLFVEYTLLNGALYRNLHNLHQYTESVARMTFVPRP